MENHLPGLHLQPLLNQILHEGAQGLHNVVDVNLLPRRDVVGVDKALAIKEGQQHLLLGAASLDLSLDGAWFSLFNLLFGLLFCLWSVVTDNPFIHCYNVVQHCHGMALDSNDEFLAGPHMLQYFVIAQEFGHPPSRLLDQPYLISKDEVHGAVGDPMDVGKILACHTWLVTEGTIFTVCLVFLALKLRWSSVNLPALT
jgi:hypothetical protein